MIERGDGHELALPGRDKREERIGWTGMRRRGQDERQNELALNL